MWKRLREYLRSLRQPAKPDSKAPSPFIRRGTARISVGLDFGTHSTKVAHLELGAGTRIVRPLRFEHGVRNFPDWVLPAIGLLRPDGLIWGGRAAEKLAGQAWHLGLRRLKVLIAGSVDPAFDDPALQEGYQRQIAAARIGDGVITIEGLAVVAVALQVAEVSRLLQATYRGRTVEPQFTIPVPIDQIQHSAVLGQYHRIINAVQSVVEPSGQLAATGVDLLHAAVEALEWASTRENTDGWLFALPEAVAQVACYARSLEVTPGVYGVVDIGAGTTDVSILAIRSGNHGELRYFWYSAMAIPMATAHVFRRVLEAVGNAEQDCTEARLIELSRQHDDVSTSAFEEIRHRSNPAWVEAYKHHLSQDRWEGCPLFLCGGGAELEAASRVFRRSYVKQWKAHDLRQLPTPRDFQSDGVPFKRMATAYGLAIPRPEHGDPVLPKDAPDHTPPRIIREYEGAGGDQLVPTGDWIGRR